MKGIVLAGGSETRMYPLHYDKADWDWFLHYENVIMIKTDLYPSKSLIPDWRTREK